LNPSTSPRNICRGGVVEEQYRKQMTVTAVVITPALFTDDIVTKIKSELIENETSELEIKTLYILCDRIHQPDSNAQKVANPNHPNDVAINDSSR
jgi:hypothetical protein